MNDTFINVYKLEKILEAITIKLGTELTADLEEGMTARQFVVMKHLHYEDRTIAELSEYLGVTPEGATLIIERMYLAGWVLKTRDQSNASADKYGLTDKGVIAFKKCWEKREQLINKYFLSLDKADQGKLLEILSKMI